MPGSSTTPGRPGARTHAPVRVAFRFRNGVSTRDINLCEAQWLAYVLPYRRFAAALTGSRARLRADVDRYSVIVSDLHRLLVAGLPAHCERFCTLSGKLLVSRRLEAFKRTIFDIARAINSPAAERPCRPGTAGCEPANLDAQRAQKVLPTFRRCQGDVGYHLDSAVEKKGRP